MRGDRLVIIIAATTALGACSSPPTETQRYLADREATRQAHDARIAELERSTLDGLRLKQKEWDERFQTALNYRLDEVAKTGGEWGAARVRETRDAELQRLEGLPDSIWAELIQKQADRWIKDFSSISGDQFANAVRRNQINLCPISYRYLLLTAIGTAEQDAGGEAPYRAYSPRRLLHASRTFDSTNWKERHAVEDAQSAFWDENWKRGFGTLQWHEATFDRPSVPQLGSVSRSGNSEIIDRLDSIEAQLRMLNLDRP